VSARPPTRLVVLGWEVILTPDPDGYNVAFEARQGREEAGAWTRSAPAAAPPDAAGSLDWQGCMNLHHAACCFHFCSRGELERFNQLLLRIRTDAAAMIDHWDGDDDE
jgi:hypothetical protein